ncbi:MAG TPA: LysR family transcriptional regulator [Mycobacteriales bacterium]|nr:LysR family transcriptional regulator [Mycobacteriales bacterium]
MQLHQLRYVLAVAEHGSFSKAADQLFLSQPALSVQVRKLERELGVPLFERLGRRVVLTSAGEAFTGHVRPALAHLDQARRSAEDEGRMRTGRVAVGALPSVAARLLPRILADFQAAHPRVEVRLIEHDVPVELERLVAEGALDLAVVRTPRARADLAARTVIREPMVALLPARHRLAGAAEVACADLADERFVAMGSGSGLRALFDAAWQRAGLVPDVAVETTQLATLWGMVDRGVGLAMVPRLASRGTAPSRGIAIVPVADAAHRELVVVWRDGGPLAPAPAAFLADLTAGTAEFSA